MPQARRSTALEVALVSGVGHGMGETVALALAARGIRVMVAGSNEHSLARIVGEIACGGGVARHAVAKPGNVDELAAAVEKTRETFGELTLFVGASADSLIISHGSADAFAKLHGPSCESSCCNELHSLSASGFDTDMAVDLALFLCSEAADGISGERILIG